MRSDVTAVCLTMGEETTERARESVLQQTLPVAETVVVEGVAPFHRAFNLAASRVETPFFVQVDADMILDPTCVADLRAAIHPEAGIAAGLLRDPLLGRLPAVKLFRTASLKGRQVPNTVAPDVDHYYLLGDAGWMTLFVLGRSAAPPSTRNTFGEHRPAYTAHYTWGTYFLLGTRYRYRRDPIGFRWRQSQLRRSSHPRALLARTAICEGLFCLESSDVPKTYLGGHDPEALDALLTASAGVGDVRVDAGGRLSPGPVGDAFLEFHELGVELGAQRASPTLRVILDRLAQGGEATWLAELALCRGFLAGDRGSDPERDFEHVRETLLL